MLSQKDLKTVSNCPLFKDMPEDDLSSALSRFHATAVQAEKGTLLLRAGDPLQCFGIVLEGVVQVFSDDLQGRHSIMANVTTGGVFGEALAWLQTESSPIYIGAAADARVLWLDPRCLLHEPRPDGFARELHWRYSTLLSQKLLEMNDRVQALSKPSIREKLITYFSQQMRNSGSAILELPMDRESLAAYLGVNRAALSRELSHMYREGLIEYHKNRIEIINPAIGKDAP